jgi:hypothetical protein
VLDCDHDDAVVHEWRRRDQVVGSGSPGHRVRPWELWELPLLSQLVIRLLKDSCDVRRKLGGHVLGSPKSLLRVTQELDDDLNAGDDLLHA